MIREDLRLRRLFTVWAPLAATFLLVTGATPVVNAAINRLPDRDHAAELAAYAVFLVCIIVLHSPLFVTREIAIKMSVDRAGSRRALLFCLSVAAVVSAIEILLGATQLGAWMLGFFAGRAGVAANAHEAFLYIWPVPFFIAVRGVYQAHQIRVDDTIFVGLGTLLRLVFTALFGFLAAPHLGVGGPMLGALCITFGIIIETAVAVARARKTARPAASSDLPIVNPVRFGVPLMIANLLGVGTSLFYIRIAAIVPEASQKASLAAFQEARSLHWLFTAGAFALQSLTTAKVRTPADVRPMLQFALIVGGSLTLLFGAIVLTPPLRDWVLIDLMNEKPGGKVAAFAGVALVAAVFMPILNAARFSLRGILIARGHSRPITFSNIVALALLTVVVLIGVLPFKENGALNAYVLWIGTLLVEIAILSRIVFRARGEAGALPPPLRTPREAAGG